MIHKIKESIRVAAIFGPGNKVRPVWFDWRGRKHDVREITYTWQEREGGALILHFTVSDGANLYELAFDSISRIWSVTVVENW